MTLRSIYYRHTAPPKGKEAASVNLDWLTPSWTSSQFVAGFGLKRPLCLLVVVCCYIDVIISEHAKKKCKTIWISRLTGIKKRNPKALTIHNNCSPVFQPIFILLECRMLTVTWTWMICRRSCSRWRSSSRTNHPVKVVRTGLGPSGTQTIVKVTTCRRAFTVERDNMPTTLSIRELYVVLYYMSYQ